MADRGRVGKFPQKVVSNEGLPLRIVRDERLDMFLQKIGGDRHFKFLPVAVRANSQRIALAEIMIGPNQNVDEARRRLNRLLGDCGYEIGQMEYPEVTASKITPWSPAVLTANV